MILECSACHARYAVPDHAIGAAGRTVRCAKCKHSWFEPAPPSLAGKPLGELDAMLDDIKTPPKPRPIPRGSNLPAIKEEALPVGIKIAAGGFALASLVIALLVYAPGLFGFSSSRGLALADVSMTKRPIEGMTLYEIKGKFINTSDETKELPILKVELVDKTGNLVKFWEFSEKGAKLEPMKSTDFTTGELGVTALGDRFIVDLGNRLELSLRRDPE
jgi:predicted Zn finger-like uncharacterized protein